MNLVWEQFARGQAAKKEREREAIKILLDFHRASSHHIRGVEESNFNRHSHRDEGGEKNLVDSITPGSKLFSLVVLIKRERVTRDDSFFLFPAFPLSPVKLIRKRKSEIVFN